MIDNILYNMDDPETSKLELAVESALLNVDRLLNTYHAICEAAEFDLREAELKCFEESGDINDLEEYYTEAKEKTEEKSKNIFKRIWDAICNICRRIRDFFTGKKDKIDPNKTYQEPKGIVGLLSKAMKVIKGLGKGIVNFVKKNYKAIIAGTFVIGGVTFLFKKKEDIINHFCKGKKTSDIKGTELIEFVDTTNEAMEKIEVVAKDLATEDNSNGDDNTGNGVKVLVQAMRTSADAVVSFITGNSASGLKEYDATPAGELPGPQATGDGTVVNQGTSKDSTKALPDKNSNKNTKDKNSTKALPDKNSKANNNTKDKNVNTGGGDKSHKKAAGERKIHGPKSEETDPATNKTIKKYKKNGLKKGTALNIFNQHMTGFSEEEKKEFEAEFVKSAGGVIKNGKPVIKNFDRLGAIAWLEKNLSDSSTQIVFEYNDDDEVIGISYINESGEWEFYDFDTFCESIYEGFRHEDGIESFLENENDEIDDMFDESYEDDDSIWNDSEFAESADDSNEEILGLLSEIL